MKRDLITGKILKMTTEEFVAKAKKYMELNMIIPNRFIMDVTIK